MNLIQILPYTQGTMLSFFQVDTIRVNAPNEPDNPNPNNRSVKDFIAGIIKAQIQMESFYVYIYEYIYICKDSIC